MSEAKQPRIGVLGSGKGSNFEAIAQACAEGRLHAEIALVISDVPDAGILAKAKARGIRAIYLDPGRYRTRLDESAERRYVQTLKEAGVEYVVLAGFMRILHEVFLESFPGRIVNIHPSLLPAFPGLKAWEQALNYGVKVTGVTIHLVDAGIDTGPILAQEAVPVLDEDTPDTLHARIQEVEHRLYPAVIEDWVHGRFEVQGRRVLRRKD